MQNATRRANWTLIDGERLDPNTALDILETKARGHEDQVIRNADLGPAVFEYLAEHGATATRKAVAANPRTPARVNRALASDNEDEVRAELAIKIARLMPDLAGEESRETVELTVATLEMLARDTAPKVRAILAEEIKHLDCIPRDVALMLAHDLDTLVSAPILEYSPLLSDADLIEIIACGRVQAILSAIAKRRPLSEKVTDVLVQSLDVPAVAALLVNPDAKIRKATLDRIVQEAEDIESWQMPLVMRADLSARAIRRLATFVGAAMLELLATRHDLDETTRERLSRRLRARLDQAAPSGEPEGAAQAVANAKAARALDDAFVEDAALAGKREVVLLALAELARVPEAIVRKIMSQHSAKPLISLVWHAHLSMRTAFRIQTTVMKLPGRELMPARGGMNFPLSKEEMRWHLSYFGIAV